MIFLKMLKRFVSLLHFPGRSYVITTQRMLVSCLESLVQKCQSGVVINFEKIGPDPNPTNEGTRIWLLLHLFIFFFFFLVLKS